MSTDDTRPHLAGTKLEWEGGAKGVLRAVSTDGHRLTKAEHDCPGDHAPMLIPHKAANEIRRLAEDAEKNAKGSSIELLATAGNLFVRTSEITLSAKLADEQFPPYAKVIPHKHKARIVVAREPFLDAVRRIALMSGEKTGGMQLAFKPGAMKVQSQNPDVGEGVEEIDVDYAGEPMSIGFNGGYVLAALTSFVGAEVSLELGGELHPAVLKPIGSELDALVVVMPMRI